MSTFVKRLENWKSWGVGGMDVAFDFRWVFFPSWLYYFCVIKNCRHCRVVDKTIEEISNPKFLVPFNIYNFFQR